MMDYAEVESKTMMAVMGGMRSFAPSNTNVRYSELKLVQPKPEKVGGVQASHEPG